MAVLQRRPVSSLATAQTPSDGDLLLLKSLYSSSAKRDYSGSLGRIVTSTAALDAIDGRLFTRPAFAAIKSNILSDLSRIDSGWVSLEDTRFDISTGIITLCHVHVPEGYDVEFLFNSDIQQTSFPHKPGVSINVSLNAIDYFPDVDSHNYGHVVTHMDNGSTEPPLDDPQAIISDSNISMRARCRASATKGAYPDRVVELYMAVSNDTTLPWVFKNIKVRAVMRRAVVDGSILHPGLYTYPEET